MNIRFYKNFSKRKNSTKRPSASDNYNDRNCYLKEDASLDNPSIVLSNREGNMSQTGNPITTSNAIASNANSCSVSFTPIQDTSGGDPSPSNPCPVSGRTEINLNVNGNIINVPFGETVYGGTCDVTSGKTINEYGFVDLGLLSWQYDSANQCFQSGLLNPLSKSGSINDHCNIFCSIYKTKNYNNNAAYPGEDNIVYLHVGGTIRIHNYAYTDALTFKAAMSGTHAHNNFNICAYRVIE